MNTELTWDEISTAITRDPKTVVRIKQDADDLYCSLMASGDNYAMFALSGVVPGASDFMPYGILMQVQYDDEEDELSIDCICNLGP